MTKSGKPIRVIAVTSGKGGVGKTNVSINLGVGLAAMGQRVILMDADLGLANVDVLLGLKPELTLADVMDGVCDLEDIILDGPVPGFKIVPASSGIKRMADLNERENAGIISAFSVLDSLTDVLIVDTAAGIADSTVNFCTAAQEVMVVVCNEPASITDAYATIKILSQDYGLSRFRILVNMVQSLDEGQILFKKLVEVTGRFLDVSLDLVAVTPFDLNVRKAVQKQKAVVQLFPDTPASVAYKQLAKKVGDWPLPKRASGGMEFFVERMLQVGDSGQWAQA